MATPPISMLCSYPQGDSSALGRELMPPGTTLVARSQKGPGHPWQGLLRETELGLLPRNKNMTKVLVVQLELQGHRAGGPTPGRSHPALPAAHLHLPQPPASSSGSFCPQRRLSDASLSLCLWFRQLGQVSTLPARSQEASLPRVARGGLE